MKERNFSEERTPSSGRPSTSNVPGKKHAKLQPMPKKFQNPRMWLELEDEDNYDDEDFRLGEDEEEEE